ncbi:ATP cone domain-containing protein, partial [Arthrospira platensis SPKY1]|nr:ATP cone domain-containing protein [Arthrospira platensis SPKY1]
MAVGRTLRLAGRSALPPGKRSVSSRYQRFGRSMSRFTHVVKRSGAVVPFNPARIANAIYRAAVAVGGRDRARADWLAGRVVDFLEATLPPHHNPHIEEIQDAVEKVLIEHGHAAVAKAYILYRDERNRRRRESVRRAAQPSGNIP